VQKGYLDAAGLIAQGTHTAGIAQMYDPATGGISTGGQTTIDNALILGMTMVGTAGDPSGRATLAADPGRSLRHAKLGAEYMLGLRAGPRTQAVGIESDEPEHTHEEG
jgi:hypothetical protein